MYKLKEIASIIKGKLMGEDVSFTGVSTDTRTISPGDLFVALVGEKFDAHDFLEQAREKGAVAALISQDVKTTLPCIKVDDTLIALGELAAWHRDKFSIPVIGLTGSCGKTTTKNLLASILNEVGSTLSSVGNLNNMIGMPLTLMKLTHSDQFAVIEMGADHIGEIDYLSKISKPTVALITCVRPVHVETFGGVENIAKGKGEIYKNLAADGVAIINEDEPYAKEWRDLLSTQSILTFGLQSGHITAKNIHTNSDGLMSFSLCIGEDEFPVSLQLLGEHNVLNALAASAAAIAVGVPLPAIQAGLMNAQPEKGRLMRKRGYHGALILDDHYNSNPAALQAALSILAGFEGNKMAILGDMLALGDIAREQHELVAAWLEDAEVDYFFAYGDLMKEAVKAFGKNAQHFTSYELLADTVRPLLTSETTVLVKGSRGMKLENVVSRLME